MYSIGLSDLKDTEETLKIFAPEPQGTAPNSLKYYQNIYSRFALDFLQFKDHRVSFNQVVRKNHNHHHILN